MIAVTEPAADALNDIPSSVATVSGSAITDGVRPSNKLKVVPVPTAAAVVNDQEPPDTAAPASVTAAEYDVDAANAASGVNVTTLVVAL